MCNMCVQCVCVFYVNVYIFVYVYACMYQQVSCISLLRPKLFDLKKNI